MTHPATLMLQVWVGALMVFMILPFELTNREFYTFGFYMLIGLLLMFCVGVLIITGQGKSFVKQSEEYLGFGRADFIMKLVCLCSLLFFLIDIIQTGNYSLATAYENRSDQAQALLHGDTSNSSLWFKLAYLTYPASCVYVVRELVFSGKIRWKYVFIFGILPGLLAAIAMGGRSPLFNVIAYGFLAYRFRRNLVGVSDSKFREQLTRIRPFSRALIVIFVASSFIYFVNVFIERALTAGGVEIMFDVADDLWGVTFSGPGFELAVNIFGIGVIFILFAFSWYLVQGVIMSNSLFESYDGPVMLGTYGIDIVSTIMRRIDPVGVADQFNYLLSLDTYGFFPSAFGTLWVDYSYGSLLVVFIWGCLAGLVYKRVLQGYDTRWRIFAPFVVMGIVFSLVNTPIGYSNGFITYIWLVFVFMTIRRRKNHEARTTS
jgi:hypothetical protein